MAKHKIRPARRVPGGSDRDFVCELPERDALEIDPPIVVCNTVSPKTMQGRPLRIFSEVRGHGAHGPRYLVRIDQPDGPVIIEPTTEPLFDAARALISKGVTGMIGMWDGEWPYHRMKGDIKKLAGLTVSEGRMALPSASMWNALPASISSMNALRVLKLKAVALEAFCRLQPAATESATLRRTIDQNIGGPI